MGKTLRSVTKASIAHWLDPLTGWWSDRQAGWVEEALSLCNWSWWVEETPPVVFPYPLSFSPDPPDSLISQTGNLSRGEFQMQGIDKWRGI